MITKRCIDEIFLTAKIEDIVGDFVSLKRRGVNFVGVCPFHNDRNPSMYVNPRLGIYKCFVCDAGGNSVNFVMEHEKISYPEALRYVAKKYGITIEEDHEASAEELASQSLRDALFTVNQFAEKFFISQLFDTEEGKNIGLNYFKERGFTESTIRHFKLGYCPGGWDKFTCHALKNGYEEQHLLTVGLSRKREGGKLFDFYHDRVIFPIHNAIGKTVGFGGRILNSREKTSKYFNSPESEIYHKSDILYGFYFAKKAIRTMDSVYLVEGYTDVISMYQAGVENVVASSGTALTDGQIKLITSQTQNIVVLYDGDNAGIKASLRGIDLLVAAGLDVKVVLLPDGEDPDSFSRKRRDSELADYLNKNAVNFLIFKAKVLSREAGNDPMKRAAMVNEMINTIAGIRDNIVRAFYIKECAALFQLSEEMLNSQLRKAVWKRLNAEKGKGEAAGNMLQQDISLLPAAPVDSCQKEYAAEDRLYETEKQLILLLIKYGMYEIDCVHFDEQGNPTYHQQRIDQFIYDELYKDELHITDPVLNTVFELYAQFAVAAACQEAIIKQFTFVDNHQVQQFLLPHLLNPEPEFSAEWQNKYEIATRTITNDKEKLNTEVTNIVNRLKFRWLESYQYTLLSLLKEAQTPAMEQDILLDLNRLTQRRIELAKLLGTVMM
ncbi:MAG: DNA primase [Bacteroidales bacterium]|jgi:DNA primase|nr:DNA primase [Bacteroidales bacterium]